MKKIILAGLIIVSGLMGSEKYNKEEISKKVESYVKMINKDLPKRGNIITVMEKIEWNKETLEIIYITKLNEYKEEGIDLSYNTLNKGKKQLKTKIRKNLVNKICKEEKSKKLMKMNVVFKYKYIWEDGKDFVNFIISKEDCI